VLIIFVVRTAFAVSLVFVAVIVVVIAVREQATAVLLVENELAAERELVVLRTEDEEVEPAGEQAVAEREPVVLQTVGGVVAELLVAEIVDETVARVVAEDVELAGEVAVLEAC
jgi:hypothetical protein